MTKTRPPGDLGYLLIMVVPFIGLGLTLTDPPTWVQIVGVVLIVGLVAASSTLIRSAPEGWLPSKSTGGRTSDEH